MLQRTNGRIAPVWVWYWARSARGSSIQLFRPSERAPSVSFSPRQSPSFPNRIPSRRTRRNRMARRSTRIRIFSCSRRSNGSDKSVRQERSYNKSGMRLIYILLLLIYYCLSLIIIITVQCLTSFSPIVSTISQSKPANQQTVKSIFNLFLLFSNFSALEHRFHPFNTIRTWTQKCPHLNTIRTSIHVFKCGCVQLRTVFNCRLCWSADQPYNHLFQTF